MVKKATGIVLEENIIKSLDNIKKECIDLGVTRSELMNAILKMYLKSQLTQQKKVEKIRLSIIKIRKGKF